MAGLGRKDFQAGAVLSAADVDGYLMDQSVMKFASDAARSSAIGTAVSAGMTSYRTDAKTIEVYDGASWNTLGAPDVAGKNKIINGGFDFWQRGSSIAYNNENKYNADRWTSSFSNAGTISRQTFTPGTAPVAGYESEFFLRFNRTTSTYNDYLTHKVEDVRTLAGQSATLSFWAKVGSGTLTTTPYVTQNFGSGGSTALDTNGVSITLTTSWQRFVINFSIPSVTGKTIGSGSFLSVNFGFLIAMGTFTFDLWGVQLEAGSVATPFSRAGGTLQGELAACQRYYYRLFPGTAGAGLGIGQATTTTGWRGGINFPVEMRIAPTALEQSGTANQYSLGMAGGGGGTLNAVPTFSGTTTRWATVNATVASGLTQFQFTYLQTDTTNGASAYLGWSAEL